MNVWLFDLGNTRLKLAQRLPDGGIGTVQAIAHDDAGAWLSGLPAGDVACLASVAASERRVALLDALCPRFARLHCVRTEPVLGALRIAYAIPEHLGVDRWLAMLACSGQGATLVVGVGTALTVDLVAADGRHLGGRIAPSPQLMRASLHARAAQLPLEGGQYSTFANDTDHALTSGCEGAALALIEHSLEAARQQLGASPALMLHGGGAPPLRARLPAHGWCPEAVLQGLARWYALRIE